MNNNSIIIRPKKIITDKSPINYEDWVKQSQENKEELIREGDLY